MSTSDTLVKQAWNTYTSFYRICLNGLTRQLWSAELTSLLSLSHTLHNPVLYERVQFQRVQHYRPLQRGHNQIPKRVCTDVELASISVLGLEASFSFYEIFLQFSPPTTTTLLTHNTQAHSRGYRNITILCLGKDCFGVDIKAELLRLLTSSEDYSISSY